MSNAAPASVTESAAPAAPPSPESASALLEELEGQMELFINAIDQPPRFYGRPNVAPIPGQPGRFGLIDPSTIDHTNPRSWMASNSRTGLATRANPHGEQTVTRTPPGKPFPKGHASARVFTADELERMTSAIDPDASGLTFADQLSEGLYARIVAVAKEASVPPGLRFAFVIKFVSAKFDFAVYAKQATDADKGAYLDRIVKHAIAAGQLKEGLFCEYERRIAAASAPAK